MSRQAAIICVAAGPQQIMLIEKARASGFAVIAVDRDSKAAGFSLASESICLSTYLAGPIVSALAGLRDRYEFKAVATRSAGPPVVTVAEIAAAFGLPGVPPESAQAVVHKAEFMTRCSQAGIAAPVHLCASDYSHLDNPRFEFPCVIKPCVGLVGKKGVYLINSPQELRRRFDETKAASYDGTVEIEAYVAGTDVTLLAVVAKGVLHPLALLDEINGFDENGMVLRRGLSIPSRFQGTEVEDKVHDLARRIVRRFGMVATPFQLSCRCDHDGGVKVIELHLDFGADQILETLLPASTSFDFIAFALKALSGVEVTTPRLSLQPAALKFKEFDRTSEFDLVGEDWVAEHQPAPGLARECGA